MPSHQAALTAFRGRYWAYYIELLNYRREPTPEKKAALASRFDDLFMTVTGYDELDDRIALTRAKKTELLAVLENPHVPLHNNAAELAARVQARVRDVSSCARIICRDAIVQARVRDVNFQTRSEQGTRIKDTFLTINQTAKKLGVSFYDYVYDRVAGKFAMPSLADLIAQKTQPVPV